MGRPKGSKNINKWCAHNIAERLNCDPLEILLKIALNDYEWLNIDSDEISVELRRQAAADAAPYMYSKRKSVDRTGDSTERIAVESLEDYLRRKAKDDE